MPPISIGPNGPVPVIIGKVLGGSGIDISAMSAMPVVPIAMAPGAARLSAALRVTLPHADEVLHLMSHGVHGVMRLVAMEGPVSRRVGDEFDGADRAYRHVDRRLRPLRALRHPAAVGAADREMMAVQMDRVVGHGEIGDPDAHPVAEPHRQDVDRRKDAGIEGPDIKVGHLGDLGQ